MPANDTQSHAIVFTDIVGSTRLYETAGDLAAKQLITDLEEEIARVAREAGGYLVEIVGDEVMCRFDDAESAAAAACRIQEWVETWSAMKGTNMQVRIGLHYGPAIFEQGRMFGDSVNIAARVASIAQARQIITTEQVVNCLSDELRDLARQFDIVKVKGKQDEIVIYDLLWVKTDVTSLHRVPPKMTTDYTELYLHYDDTKYVVASNRGGYRIGRGLDNDLVVAAGSASRAHAKIEFTRGKFVLSDLSTNGTFVLTGDNQSIYLRREELPLWGSGKIGLGEPVSDNNRCLIRYEVR